MSRPGEPGERELTGELCPFLLELGRLLVASGDAISDVELRLLRIAAHLDAPEVQLAIFPTAIALAPAPGANTQLMRIAGPALRLDQINAVLDIARDAENGVLDPSEGLVALSAVIDMPNRYGRAAAIAGQVVVILGIALVLRPSHPPIGLYLGLGLMVALLQDLSSRLATFDALLPVLAGGAVSVAAFLAAGGTHDATSIQTLIPPLVLLLPGGLLTMATIDLAAGQVVTGSSRFLAGMMQLALLSAGILAGAALVGAKPASEPAAVSPAAWWVQWLGLLIFGVGIALWRSVPTRTLPWLMFVLVVAFAAQLLGNKLFGAQLSGFFGGLAAAPLALALEQVRGAPPAFVSFLPAFWLLVPGAVGLVSIADLASGGASGAVGFVDAIGAVIAIALGILVGIRVFAIGMIAISRRRQLAAS